MDRLAGKYIERCSDYVKNGSYAASSLFTCMDRPFTELEGKTWGIIGLGAIGRKVASIAQAFGCRVTCAPCCR